ncbi:MAG: T9SS type A sorting domain-containing protein [Bacteroidia bacterium]
MKPKLLIVLALLISSNSIAQDLPGLKKIAEPQNGVSFIHKDKSNTVWIGLGGLNYNLQYSNFGLKRYSNNQLIAEYNQGSFTAALETDSELLITAINGLYTYSGDSMLINSTLTGLTSITKYKDSIWIGSIDQGLFSKKNNSYHKYSIVIDGVKYDSIHSVCGSNNNLYIGTTKGLIQYKDGIFTKIEIPFTNTGEVYYNELQKVIVAMQMDGYGRLWFLNANRLDSLSCLYVLENNTVVKAHTLYKNDCNTKANFPFSSFHLNRSEWGHILMGTYWGITDISDEVSHLILNSNMNNVFSLESANSSSIPQSLAYEAKDGKLYASIYTGIFELDPTLYNNQHMKEVLSSSINNRNTLDINDLSIGINNDGSLFSRSDFVDAVENPPTFRSKSIGCLNAHHTAALWMGGLNSSTKNLHLAAQTYKQRGSDYLPGPVNTTTMIYDSIISKQYNQVWKVDRETIDDFRKNRLNSGYIIPSSILDWPGNSPANYTNPMAPYVDVDNNGVYDPTQGDYPKIKGDQMLWWVFNDLGIHGETGGRSLGAQINASAYAYKDIRLTPSDPNFIINRTMFVDYTVFNSSMNTYDDFLIGIMNDIDLGFYGDDMVSCDTLENAGFGFNASNFDPGKDGFGKNPPMVFCKFMNQKMDYFMTYSNSPGGNNGFPLNPNTFYAYLQSSFYFKDTIRSNNPYQITGYPCSLAPASQLNDVRFLMSSKQNTFAPGTQKTLSFSYILVHDPNIDFLKDSCDKPKQSIQKIQNWYDADSFPRKPYWPASIPEIGKNDLIVFPNPSNSKVFVKAENPIQSIEVFSSNGQLLLSMRSIDSNLIEMDTCDFAEGIYILKAVSDGTIIRKTFIKLNE